MGSLYEHDPEMAPDSQFELARPDHLVIGNDGRRLLTSTSKKAGSGRSPTTRIRVRRARAGRDRRRSDSGSVSSPLGVRFGHHVEDYEKGCMAADAEKQQG